MANYSRVGMQELDQKLSKVVQSARTRPVSVHRYGAPWVWIVSQEAWQRLQVDIESFLPLRHPLIELREKLANLDIAHFELTRFEVTHGAASNCIRDGASFFHALVLWAARGYRESAEELHQKINYNLLYRWFVGLGMHQKIWPEDIFVKSVSALKRNETLRRKVEIMLSPALVQDVVASDS